MDAKQIERVAGLFVEARRARRPLPPLSDDLRPVTTQDVNAIVDVVTAVLVSSGDETIGGWKIGFVYSPRQQPMICPLFDSRLVASPARVPRALTAACLIEPEISFRLTHDLPGRAKAYRAEEVAEALVACASLELIDTRFDTSTRSIRQMLDDKKTRLEAMADHNTTGAYVTAAGRPDWQDFDFATLRVTMRTPTRVLVETVGGHAFSDPFLPCVVLVNQMRHRGGVRAGQLLVTGSFSGFFPVTPGETVTAEFEGFGSAQATYVDG